MQEDSSFDKSKFLSIFQADRESRERLVLGTETPINDIENFISLLDSLFITANGLSRTKEFDEMLEVLKTNPIKLDANLEYFTIIFTQIMMYLNLQNPPQLIAELIGTTEVMINHFLSSIDVFFENDFLSGIANIIESPDSSIQLSITSLLLSITNQKIDIEHISQIINNFGDLLFQWAQNNESIDVRVKSILIYGNFIYHRYPFPEEIFIMIAGRFGQMMREENEEIFEAVCWTLSNFDEVAAHLSDKSIFVDIFKAFWIVFANFEEDALFENSHIKFLYGFITEILFPLSDEMFDIIDLERLINTAINSINKNIFITLLSMCIHPNRIGILMLNGLMQAIAHGFTLENRSQRICVGIMIQILKYGDINQKIVALSEGLMDNLLTYIPIVQDDISCEFMAYYAASLTQIAEYESDEFSFDDFVSEYDERGWYDKLHDMLEVSNDIIYNSAALIIKTLNPNEEDIDCL